MTVSPPEPAVSSLSLLDRAGGDTPLPPPAPMPVPDVRLGLPMSDGTRLDTQVWLPAAAASGDQRVAAILLRTPYKESVMGFRRLGVLRYVEAGYAVVIQTIRGIGASEGRFLFCAPHERGDGHDTVEWIAAQPWCDGAVGMDGSSYVAITQIAAAVTCPPHLRCIAPTVPTLDYFLEVPYCGGIFSRQHTINWLRLLQVESLNEMKSGYVGTMPVLSRPEVLQRMTSRPLIDAADGELSGDFLAHYRDTLAHPTFDEWFAVRTFSAEDIARITIPTLLVNGNFDTGIGSLALWRQLEAHAGNAAARSLLIGPWDHGQAYAGGASRFGPYELGEQAVLDLHALRLRFFDQHLRGRGDGIGAPPGRRVQLFVTGRNEWRAFEHYPPRETRTLDWYLASEGRAHTARGDGVLRRTPPATMQPGDRFVDDPTLPFVAALAAAREGSAPLDLRERERHHETLVYDSGVLDDALTLLGEPEVELYTAADVPDADLIVWLAEHRSDGATVQLSHGQLRLRYRDGFAMEKLLGPGEVVRVRIPLTYVAHEVPRGSSLRLLVGGSNFPWADPNPHGAEPIATAVAMQVATQTVFHDIQRPSRLTLRVV